MKILASVCVGAAVAVALATPTAARQPSSDTRAIVTAFQSSHVLAEFDYLPQEITWADDAAAVSLRRKKHDEDECEKESEEEENGRHGRHGRKEEKEHDRYGKHGEKESHGHGKRGEKDEKKTHGKYGKKEDKKSLKYGKKEEKNNHGKYGKYGKKDDDDEYGECRKKHHVRQGHGNDEDVGGCGGREENATLKFAATLQQDTESFIADVRDWVDSLMGNVSGSTLVVDTTFTLSLSGDVDMRHPCGGLVANKMFPILEPYVNDPANADFNKTESSKILWRPSRACLKQRNAVEVDGGAHAEFEVRCGDTQLLNATVATGGVSRKIFWHNLQFSGALVSVDVLNGTIRAVGASGLIGELIKYWDVPDNADEILANLTDTAHECAANNTLVVRGLVGGGWRQVFAHSGSSWNDENDGEDDEDEEEVAVVGYAEAFELSYKADAEPPADAPASETPPSDSPADSKAPATKPSTEAPTDAPKVTTTARPVEKPADAPTEPPTTQPTPSTNASTDAPKVTTTAPPVEKPTDAPTEPRTTQPTPPTNAPADAPANVPAGGPTKTPTEPPTKAPTEAPMMEPTKTSANDASTMEPTNAPTPKTTTPAPTKAPAEGPTAPAGSVGDLTAGTLKDLSESASALYVQSGIQCHHHDVSKACFMNTAMSKIIHGKLSTVRLAMSHKQEEDLSPASFFSAHVLVVVALVSAAVVDDAVEPKVELAHDGREHRLDLHYGQSQAKTQARASVERGKLELRHRDEFARHRFIAQALERLRPHTNGVRAMAYAAILTLLPFGEAPDHVLTGIVPTPSSSLPTDTYLLLFDGGSRGNPGPGGAGAVVFRTSRLRDTPQLVWSAAMSLTTPTNNNNQAEYVGLVTGLAAAARHNWRPLEVVGDSLLIVRQMDQYHPPKTERLVTLYREARHLADRLGVERWSHHLRACNKMADAAANVAMDGRRSIQTFHPTLRPEWAGLPDLLLRDFHHWRSASPQGCH